MASWRHITRVFSKTAASSKIISRGARSFSSKSGGGTAYKSLLLGSTAVCGVGVACAVYKTGCEGLRDALKPKVVHAASVPESQSSVFSETKQHALYLWIHLKPEANAKQCVKVVANLQAHVDAVCPPDLRDENDEVFAGVGFGPEFWYKVWGRTKKDYSYKSRSGIQGDLPSSGGDIFIHAKSDCVSKLFELTQRILAQLPANSISTCEDIYGWVYQNGRDLSGFIDGTENPADEAHRQQVAVERATGGSYVITQKWMHRLDVVEKAKDSVLEGWIGRNREDSTELHNKPITSHVARMTGGANFEQKKMHEIVRQSQPFGTVTGDHGLFFIAYSATPEAFNYMLDRMVGSGDDKHSDDIMRISQNVKGTFWYFPGAKELRKLA